MRVEARNEASMPLDDPNRGRIEPVSKACFDGLLRIAREGVREGDLLGCIPEDYVCAENLVLYHPSTPSALSLVQSRRLAARLDDPEECGAERLFREGGHSGAALTLVLGALIGCASLSAWPR